MAASALLSQNRVKIAALAAFLFFVYLIWLFGPISNRFASLFSRPGTYLYSIETGEPVESAAFHNGKIYAVTKQNYLVVFTSTGRRIKREKIKSVLPRRIAVDSEGFIYLSCLPGGTFRGFVTVYDGDLNLMAQHNYTERFEYPLAILATDKLYVADGNIIRVFTLFDSVLREDKNFGGTGSHSGQFMGISGLSVAEDGTLFVLDSGNNRVQAFSRDQEFLSLIPTAMTKNPLADPVGSTFINSNIYVADGKKKSVFVFTREGKIVDRIESSFKSVTAIVSGDSKIFIADPQKKLISAWKAF